MSDTPKLPDNLQIEGFTALLPSPVSVTDFAEVWKAVENDTGRQVAVKVLKVRSFTDRDMIARELQALALLHTAPHVATLLRNGVRAGDGMPWLAFAWYDATLADYMGAVTPVQAAHVGVGLCDALDAAHSVGVFHRDLKPTNVLIRAKDSNLHAVLTDFGIARVGTQNTIVPGVKGTFPFIAPEWFTSPDFRGDEKSDVYALAATLYAAVVGRMPFEATSDEALIHATLFTAPPALPYALDAPVLSDLLRQGMSKVPADRPTIAGFRESLLSLSVPPGSRPVTVPVPVPRSAPSSYVLPVAIALLVGSLIVGTMFWLGGNSNETAGAPTASTTSTSSPPPTATAVVTEVAETTEAPTTTAKPTTTPAPTTTAAPTTTTTRTPVTTVPPVTTLSKDMVVTSVGDYQFLQVGTGNPETVHPAMAMHASYCVSKPHSVDFNLGGKYKTFSVLAGFQNKEPVQDKWKFTIAAVNSDGVSVIDSTILGKNQTHEFKDLSVDGVVTLQLSVTAVSPCQSGWAPTYYAAVWADSALRK